MTERAVGAPASATPGEFRVGLVFSRAWDVLSGNVTKFLPLTAILALPTLIVLIPGFSDGAVDRATAPKITAGAIAAIFASIFVWIILNVITEAAVLYGSFQAMRNRPVQIGESFKKGLARLLPIIGLSICMGIALVLGGLALFFPAFILATMFFVALPVCVVEGLGPIKSMGRSSALTKGHRWKIFGIWLILALVGGIVSAVISAVLSVGGLVVSVIGRIAWDTLIGAYQSIVVAVVYHDLRVAKEGVDIEHIASVFD
jgi:uncharacterized membrane protein